MKSPIRIAITGAAGQVGYSVLFRIAAGDMLGKDQPVILQLIEIESAMKSVDGVIMELEDCAFPLLERVEANADPMIGFKGAQLAILIGARPRSKGMLRKDLLAANGPIFASQGMALNEVASRDVRVLVVGNPANTNCYIAMCNAPDLSASRFSAMVRLDQNRATFQAARKLGVAVSELRKVTIWGNHSATQYPDLHHAEASGKPLRDRMQMAWIQNEFIPTVQQRGKAIIEARGLSSAASAANAVIDHVHDWVLGTREDGWASMAVPSDGSYGAPEGLVCGFPCRCVDGNWQIVQGLDIDDFSKGRIQASWNELQEEADTVRDLVASTSSLAAARELP